MSNSTLPIQRGTINHTHTTNLQVYYAADNLPTPWPLLTASILLSLILGFIGFRSACVSWMAHVKRIRVVGAKTWKARARQNLADGASRIVQGPGAPTELVALNGDAVKTDDFDEAAPSPDAERPLGTFAQARTLVAFLWSSFRALLAFALSVKVAVTGKGTHSAPSSLLILLISTQTFLASRAMPRIMNFLLLLDTVAASLAFLLAAYDHRDGTYYYGEYSVEGGNCPQYSSDCAQQFTRWREVGCGPWPAITSTQTQYNKSIPHATDSDFNYSLNVLHQAEAAISVFGCIWLLTVVGTVYGCRHLLGSHLTAWFQPVERDMAHSRLAIALLASFFGVFFAVIIAIVSIVVHWKQATHQYTATFLDGFGHMAPVNLTYASPHLVNGSHYWGDAHHWTDCFNVSTPLSHDGFWTLWWESNFDSVARTIFGF